jgi:hypothetical protein
MYWQRPPEATSCQGKALRIGGRNVIQVTAVAAKPMKRALPAVENVEPAEYETRSRDRNARHFRKKRRLE